MGHGDRELIIPKEDWKLIENANAAVQKRFDELCKVRTKDHERNILIAEMSYLNAL